MKTVFFRELFSNQSSTSKITHFIKGPMCSLKMIQFTINTGYLQINGFS